MTLQDVEDDSRIHDYGDDFEEIHLDMGNNLECSFDEQTLHGLIDAQGKRSTKKRRAPIPKFEG